MPEEVSQLQHEETVLNNTILDISSNAEVKVALAEENEQLNMTKLQDGTMNSAEILPDSTECHKARICVICDEFAVGMERHEWIGKTTLLQNSHWFQADYNPSADSESSPEYLKQYYRVQDMDLQWLLLSPRCCVQNRTQCMICTPCKSASKTNWESLESLNVLFPLDFL